MGILLPAQGAEGRARSPEEAGKAGTASPPAGSVLCRGLSVGRRTGEYSEVPFVAWVTTGHAAPVGRGGLGCGEIFMPGDLDAARRGFTDP